MKQFLKILLSVWVISGLAIGSGYATVQTGRYREQNSKSYSSSKYSDSKVFKAAVEEQYQKNFIECENELEDDDELLSENFLNSPIQCLRIPTQKHFSVLGRNPLSCSYTILYCVFRI